MQKIYLLPVLTGAIRQLCPAASLQELRGRVQARSLSPTIISISAQGNTAAQAAETANAVASSYVDYLSSAMNPGLRMPGAETERAPVGVQPGRLAVLVMLQLRRRRDASAANADG